MLGGKGMAKYANGEPLNAFQDGILEEIPALQLWEKQYLCTPRAYVLILHALISRHKEHRDTDMSLQKLMQPLS